MNKINPKKFRVPISKAAQEILNDPDFGLALSDSTAKKLRAIPKIGSRAKKLNLKKEVKQKLNQVFRGEPVNLAYLFGSKVIGQEINNSDVDIAVLLTEGLTKEKRFEVRLNLMGKLSKIFKKNVDLVILNDTASLFFKYIIVREGKSIYERSEAEKINFENYITSLYFDFQPFLETYNRHYVKNSL